MGACEMETYPPVTQKSPKGAGEAFDTARKILSDGGVSVSRLQILKSELSRFVFDQGLPLETRLEAAGFYADAVDKIIDNIKDETPGRIEARLESCRRHHWRRYYHNNENGKRVEAASPAGTGAENDG